MRRDRWSRLVGVVGAGLLGLVLLGTVTRTAAHQGDGIVNAIHACVANNGNVRIVGVDGLCKGGETAAHWGIQGPQGDPGLLSSFDDLAGLLCTDPNGTPGSIKVLFWGQSAMLACATGRFIDLGLTVYDTQTNLEWEKKAAGSGCLHCVDDSYTWCQATGIGAPPTCSVSPPSWIIQVNQEGFAGHRDWRIPTGRTSVNFDGGELATILLAPFPSCVTSPCIDPIFGPTASANYWSATGSGQLDAWDVDFADGGVDVGFKGNPFRVRAVRGGP